VQGVSWSSARSRAEWTGAPMDGNIEHTLIHYKPVVYGSPLANRLFLALLGLHILAAGITFVASIAAFAAKKGGKLHLFSGAVFVRAMLGTALTGMVVDIVRLTVHYRDNHTKYVGTTYPSIVSARLGFLYAALCVLYLLRESSPPRAFRRGVSVASAWTVPGILLGIGAILTAIIYFRLDFWFGTVWIIWTFAAIIWVFARLRAAKPDSRAAGVARHRWGMAALAAFTWWGAMQGFGPAVAGAVGRSEHAPGHELPKTQPYAGDRYRPQFSPMFFRFFAGFAMFFVPGGLLVWRFARRARRMEQSGANVMLSLDEGTAPPAE
jgi:hypothetical protein